MTPQQGKAVQIMHHELAMTAHEIVDDFTHERVHITLAAVNKQIRRRERQGENTFITFQNQTRSITEWEKITGITRQTLYQRIEIHNWSTEKALTTPVKKHGKNRSTFLATKSVRKKSHRPASARLH